MGQPTEEPAEAAINNRLLLEAKEAEENEKNQDDDDPSTKAVVKDSNEDDIQVDSGAIPMEDLLDKVCGLGRFTWLVLVIGFINNICPGAISLGHALFLYAPKFQCDVNATLASIASALLLDENYCDVSVSDDQCSLNFSNCTLSSRIACTNWNFDSTHLSVTVVTRFQLVCDRAPLSRLPATMYFVGFLIGSTGYGMLSDRIGRRPALLIATLHLSLFAFVVAAVPAYWLLLIAEVFTGAGTAGVITVSCALLVELTPRRLRSQLLFNGSHGWCMGILLIGLAAWLMPDYRHQLATAGCVGLIGASCTPLLGESPRWLLATGRHRQAVESLQRIATWNRRNLPKQLQQQDYNVQLSRKKDDDSGIGIFQLFRRPGLRRITLLSWALFFSIAMCYYGVGLSIGSLGGSVVLSCVLLALFEPPSRLLGGFLCTRFGRRPVLGVCFACIGASIIVCSLIFNRPGLAPVRTACAIFGTFWSCLAFTAVWLYANEAFPTPVRTAGAGSGSTLARVGALLSTLVAMLDVYWPPAPFAVFGCVAMATLVVVYLLPETGGMIDLPATMDEGDKLGRLIGSGSGKRKSKSRQIVMKLPEDAADVGETV